MLFAISINASDADVSKEAKETSLTYVVMKSVLEFTVPYTTFTLARGRDEKGLIPFQKDLLAKLLSIRGVNKKLFVDPKTAQERNDIFYNTSKGPRKPPVFVYCIGSLKWKTASQVEVYWSASDGPLSGSGAMYLYEWENGEWKYVKGIGADF